MSRPTIKTFAGVRLAPCDGTTRLAGSGGRATVLAAKHAELNSEGLARRDDRVTPPAMPDAPEGAWLWGHAGRGDRGSLSAPESTLRRGAEREPLTWADELTLQRSARGSAASRPADPRAKRLDRGGEGGAL